LKIAGDESVEFSRLSVVNTDGYRTALAKLAIDPADETPKEFAQLVKSDFDRWGPIVQASGFTPED
jgi:tripartite-type tricarboxylate transporter receptor subunit TctC